MVQKPDRTRPADTMYSARRNFSTTDLLTLSLAQAANAVSDCAKGSSRYSAMDRFLGSAHVYRRKFHGENVRFFKPHLLTPFEFAVLAHVAHESNPCYSLLSTQCYFYAALVYTTAQVHGKVHTESASNTDNKLVNIHGPHLSDKYGRWNAVKVMDIDLDSHEFQAFLRHFKAELQMEINKVRKINEPSNSIFYYIFHRFTTTKASRIGRSWENHSYKEIEMN